MRLHRASHSKIGTTNWVKFMCTSECTSFTWIQHQNNFLEYSIFMTLIHSSTVPHFMLIRMTHVMLTTRTLTLRSLVQHYD